MFARNRSSVSGHWLLRLLALVAMAAQLVVAFAPLAEGRDSRMGSHVEASGSRAHFVHDEARCPACQARSIHGTAPKPDVPFVGAPLRPTAVLEFVGYGISGNNGPQANPRAPPSVI
ncbi:MAG TPA: hypothetical protein VH277_05685 [Gemmatimonadaceae bacterium]|jgi:hypothetical protein|nr:hypothetical protein [Gemmatimonadaceae bacterium]